jgi:hypothetical protein
MTFLSGFRFRRQHWCLLSVIVLVLVLCVCIGLPLSGDADSAAAEMASAAPEVRMAAVHAMLAQVPLVDG